MDAAKCPINTPFAVNPATLPTYLTIGHVALLCALSPSTIQLRVRKGKFPKPVAISPKKHFWPKADVLEFLSSCKASQA